MLVNAAIIAGIGFFTVLAGMKLAQIKADLTETLWAAGIAFILQFLSYLAAQRGLKRGFPRR